MTHVSKANNRYAVLFGLLFCVLALPKLFVHFFEYSIIARISQFGMIFVWTLVNSCFLLGVVMSILYCIGYFRALFVASGIPLLLFCLVYAAPQFVPFSDWSLHHEINTKQAAREEIVHHLEQQLNKGEIFGHLVLLPSKYRYVSSAGGEVIFFEQNERQSFAFYIWRGVLDTSSGLVIYTSDDSLPSFFIGYPVYEEKIKDNWYFVIW
jgi:nicotinamide riboside transporter PnuC